MSLTDIKERVCKLLALSNSSNENEAAVALAMAQKIILEYKLSIAECLAAGEYVAEEQIIRDGTPLITTGRIAQWQSSLCGVLARSNDCKILLYKGLGIVIFGRPSDIQNVRTMLSFCIGQLWKLSPKGRGKVYSDSWYLGAISTMDSRLKEMRAKAIETVTTFGLVKLNEQTAKVDTFIKETEKTKAGIPSSAKFDGSAYFQGRQDGHKVNLNTHKELS